MGALIEASRGIKRSHSAVDEEGHDKHKLRNAVQQDEQPMLNLAERYQSNPLIKENMAQDIFSTSSTTITFNNIPKKTTGSSDMAPPVMVGQKKKKIRGTSNKSIITDEKATKEEVVSNTKSGHGICVQVEKVAQ